MVTLDLINTVAFGGVVLFAGYTVRRVVPGLARYNVPAAVIGGLLVAVTLLAARRWDVELVTFDTRLQTPFMIAFFTTVGFGASFSLLKVGGPQVLLFFILSSALAVAQNVVDRYGPAPRAFLVVPMVGAFFIDFVNAVIITVCLNVWT